MDNIAPYVVQLITGLLGFLGGYLTLRFQVQKQARDIRAEDNKQATVERQTERTADHDDFEAVTERLDGIIKQLEARIGAQDQKLEDQDKRFEEERRKRWDAEGKIAVLEARVGRLMFFVDTIHAIITRDCPNPQICPLWPILNSPAMDKLPIYAAVQATRRRPEDEDGKAKKEEKDGF